MGVAGFTSFLKRRYPEAFVSQPGTTVDHLYLDLSSTLHQILRKARTRAYFHYLLHKRLDAILAVCQPTKRVVFALDGPAPLAKLLEQRRRRRREDSRARTSLSAGSAGKADSGSSYTLSSLMLTTGTPLMLEMHQSLAYYICKRLADPQAQHLHFELSDSTVKGEGELKILQRILDLPPAWELGDGQEPESHMILGADSDLLLMAMVSGRPRLYVCDDSQDFEQMAKAARDQLQTREQGQLEGAELLPDAAATAEAVGVSPTTENGGIDAGPRATLSSSESGHTGADSSTASSSGGGHAGLKVFSRDTMEQLWQRRGHLLQHEGEPDPSGVEEILGSGQVQQESVALALDLLLLAIMCGGNDYLPAMQGLQLTCKHRPGLWDLYLELAGQPEWQGRRLVRRRGEQLDGDIVRLDVEMLLELLQRYEDRRMQGPSRVEEPLQSEDESTATSSGEEDEIAEEAVVSPSQEELRRASALLRQADAQHALASLDPRLLGELRLRSKPAVAEAVVQSVAASSRGATAIERQQPAAAACSCVNGSGASRSSGGRPGEEAVCGREASGFTRCADKECAYGGAGQPVQQRPRPRASQSTQRGLEPDVREYIKGLEWVLRMYTAGRVPDYRWTYDMGAPSLQVFTSALRKLYPLAAEAGAAPSDRTLQGATGAADPAAVGAVANVAASGDAAFPDMAAAMEAAEVAAAAASRPLLPAACALALLPMGGRSHAPTALRHLMDEGSPLAELYAVCDHCSSLGRQLGLASRDLYRVRQELLELRRVMHSVQLALEAAQVMGGPSSTEPGAGQAEASPQEWPSSLLPPQTADELGYQLSGQGEDLSGLQKESVRLQAAVQAREEAESQLRATIAGLSRAQQEHFAERHPYRPFPTADLEAAVAAVPAKQHPWHERRLLRFGRDLLFRRGDGAEAGQHGAAPQPQQAAPTPSRAPEQPGPASPPAPLPAPGGEALPLLEPLAAAAAGAAAGSGATGSPGIQRATPWLQECAAFAATYHRFVDRSFLSGVGAQGILREALPISRTLRSRHGSSNGGAGRATKALAAGSARLANSGKLIGKQLAKQQAGLAKQYGVPVPRLEPGGPAASLQMFVRQYSSSGGVFGVGSSGNGVVAVRPAISGGGVQGLLRQCSRLLPSPYVQRRLFRCLRCL